MINACLIGKKLGHSYSPFIHSFFGYDYQNVELEEDNIERFLKNSPFNAFNVTVPYKKTVMPYLELDELAKRLGAVNTIVKRDGKLYGYNTDYYGFKYLVESNGVNVKDKKVLILGTGGASAVANAYMNDCGANVIVVGRTSENNYNNICKHYDAKIIINTTPVGMYPDNLKSPLDLSPFKELEFVGDLIYNPFKTAILLQAESMGIKTENGLSMLVYQAIQASFYFTGKNFSSLFNKIYSILSLKARNIVLIGMPSSGKTTVGKLLAKELKREFIDLDEEIVKKEKCDIPTLFKEKGEPYFRKVENEILNELSKLNDKVISLGGGACMHENAKNQLKQNSVIVYLTRTAISTNGRPLLAKNGLEAYKKLQEIRTPVYKSLADYEIANNGKIGNTVNKIKEVLNENNSY